MKRGEIVALARESLARGEALAWFEQVYATSGDGGEIPWADLAPNPLLVSWLDSRPVAGRGLVVGCGLGDDAEELAARGLAVTAFDVAPTAIALCRRRFPASSVDYVVADAFALPEDWRERFDFAFEAYTLQSLPSELRAPLATAIADCLAPGGSALVVARGRDEDEPADGPPWPLTVTEVERYFVPRLELVALDDFADPREPNLRRLRMTVRRGK
jgi:SAM-dependent methyltransferase